MKQPEGKKRWVQVVFPMREEREFTYFWPPDCSPPRIGTKVLVPLGKAQRKGFVTRIITQEPSGEISQKIKPIFAISNDSSVLTQNLSQLIKRTSQYYVTSFASILRGILPRAAELFSEITIELNEIKNTLDYTNEQKKILDFLKSGPVDFSVLSRQNNNPELLDDISNLVLSSTCRLRPSIKKTRKRYEDQYVLLAISGEDLNNVLSGHLGEKQKTAFKALQSGEKNLHQLKEKYGIDFRVLKRMEKKGWITTVHKPGPRVILPIESQKTELSDLSKDQRKIFDKIKEKIRRSQFSAELLFGVPGSGKTEIYLHAAKTVLEQNKSVVVLVPEIALTGQVAARFHSIFGEEVALWHSGMSPSERKWTWEKLRSGQARIVVGARSAVFSPLQNIGLIIVDEEQETSFKQQNPAPRYHARDVAIMRTQIEKAVILLGSATPSLESYFNAIRGRFTMHELKKRFGESKPPEIQVVDMKSERREQGEFSMFSRTLLDEIGKTLDRGKQIILFQNRRGFSPFVSCSECGKVETCLNCHVSMTFHKRGKFLLCHHCGYRSAVPDQCRDCFSNRLFFPGTGTQHVEEILEDYFPEVRVLRMDRDTTTKSRSHTEILNAFMRKEANILLGTQMIGKGLDFPNVMLVGILQADLGLFYPDFRSRERTFQLLYQVAGRAGRRKERGKVIIQATAINDLSIKTVVSGKILQFYNTELSDREQLNYPPFSRIATLTFIGKSSIETRQAATTFRVWIDMQKPELTILGPVPLIIEKINNKFRHKIEIRASKANDPNSKKLHKFLEKAHVAFHQRRKFKYVAMDIDVDPVGI